MTPEERKLMIEMGKKYNNLDSRIKVLENAGVSKPDIPLKGLKTTSKASDKFFGINPKEPQLESQVVGKDPLTTDKQLQAEIEKGHQLIRKVITEYCKEFQIKYFVVNYIDETPKTVN